MPGTLVFRNHHQREHRLHERAVRVVERKHRRLWSADKMKGPIPDLSPNTPDMEHTTPEGVMEIIPRPLHNYKEDFLCISMDKRTLERF